MNRGRRAHVYLTQLFAEPTSSTSSIILVSTKGRSAPMLLARNKMIVARYYYKAKLQRKLYDDILAELNTEFCLCNKTIYNVLFIDCHHLVMDIMQTKPDVKSLRKQYPFYNFS